jgi:hypothetical protein
VSEADVAYYRRRASDERHRAREASRANVAAIHEELAKQYEALIEHAELRCAGAARPSLGRSMIGAAP